MRSQRKDHMQKKFPFEMINQLTRNFLHRHYTNSDYGDIIKIKLYLHALIKTLFLEKSFIILMHVLIADY